MPREIGWTDFEEIGIQLQEKFPEIDPYTVRFTDLHKYVSELPGFTAILQSRTRAFSKPSRRPGMRSTRTPSRRRVLRSFYPSTTLRTTGGSDGSLCA